MPPEPTKSKVKRRTSRKDLDDFRFDGTHARELELKRTRGEVSCAECRRLKIKCDKQVPCQSCVRRGCVALCPNGSLSTGQGTRFVLAATEHLHKRIGNLGGRVRQLEDALATLQASHSTEPHPLLHDDLITIDEPEPEAEMTTGEAAGGQAGDVIDAFGTLSISEHGVSRFFGPTGGSESLLAAGSDSAPHDSPELSARTPESTRDSKSPMSIGDVTLFSQYFPFTPLGQPPQVQELIETHHLPPYDKALEYCDVYFEQVSWLFRGVTKEQVLDMIPVVYKRQSPSPGEEYTGPHDLALLFGIFSIASLVGHDPSVPHSDHYYQVARAALSLQPVLEKPSTVTIQTMHLLSIYNAMSGSDLKSDASMETTWSLITLASHLSLTIGLHRDSARWGLSPKMVQRRRILFWDLFVADVWQSLNTGRPPAFSLPYIDCGLPQYEDVATNLEKGFEIWQFRFAAEVVAEVSARTLTAETPSYATIMDLDRKVREFPIPESMMSKPGDDFSTAFQLCVLDHIRETVLLYIHRSFFAQAIIDHPKNPLKSPYAPSFLAAYRASSTILKSVQEHFTLWPQSSSRFWTMWTFAFSASVVFGTVVTRGPRSPLAKSAMRELEQACILFSKASVYSMRATKALPILKKLSEKARYALSAAQSDPSGDNGLHWTIKQEDTEDELAIFAGHTRFVNAKRNPDPNGAGPDRAGGSPPNQIPGTELPLSVSTAPSIRQPQPVLSHRFDPSSSNDSRMDTSETNWSDNSAAHHIPMQPGETHYDYPHSAHERPMDYNWMHSHQDIPPVRFHHASHPPEPRLSRPVQSNNPIHISPADHSQVYYSSRDEGVNVRSPSPFYPPHNQTYPSTYGHRMSTSADPPPVASSSSAGPRYLGRQPSQSYPHPHSPTTPYTSTFSSYPAAATFTSQSALPNPALADLGIASRDSRLDEKWSMFMADSGILEEFNYRPS
ncbi:hypothetical protein FA15DRAFT_672344 [Coprinopsis marcescibilis]|uniref:Zn(2)-C6 fungal-type domain-containing protein n=1 Tax=Coprinopsis marcescibilis TaxID=230819 RepID=A0A5C3KNK3_COPMA|nr:hypothetical protein FA15DRAFT_672344 [Coprinopsis marcescibilis]